LIEQINVNMPFIQRLKKLIIPAKAGIKKEFCGFIDSR